MRISTVKLVISFSANAKFKDIPCIVNHHYHIFHVLRRFYCVNKSCSIVFQLQMIPDYVSIVYWVTRWHRLGGRLTGVKLGWEIHREYDFHSLHRVYQNRLLTFHTYYTGKIFGSHGRPRYNGVRVLMEQQCL